MMPDPDLWPDGLKPLDGEATSRNWIVTRAGASRGSDLGRQPDVPSESEIFLSSGVS